MRMRTHQAAFLQAEIYPPAGLLRRLGAMCYDGLLIVALWLVTTGLVVAINGSAPVSGAWFQSLLFLEACAFFLYFWQHNQATLGMQAWRLRLQLPSGARISLRQGGIRCLVGALSWLAFGLGFLWILIDPSRRSWTDLASGTQVVVVPPGRGMRHNRVPRDG